MVEFLTSLFQFSLLAKIFLLVVILFYLIFTVVVYRQISLMTQTFNSAASAAIRSLAIGQILVIAGLFLLGLFIL